MDKATYKQIDSLYRNLKQLPLLAVLGILVPILLPIVPLLSLAYLFLRSRLLSEVDSGDIAIDPVADAQSAKVGELSVIRKLEYIRNSGGRHVEHLINLRCRGGDTGRRADYTCLQWLGSAIEAVCIDVIGHRFRN